MRRLLPGLLLLAGCARAPEAASCPPGAQIVLTDVWIRAAEAGGNSALYAKIQNCSGADDALLGARTTAVSAAELHMSARTSEGVATMTAIDEIEIRAKGGAALTPGGAHLMLIGVIHPLSDGSSVPVTFEFRNAGPIETTAIIRPAGAVHPH